MERLLTVSDPKADVDHVMVRSCVESIQSQWPFATKISSKASKMLPRCFRVVHVGENKIHEWTSAPSSTTSWVRPKFLAILFLPILMVKFTSKRFSSRYPVAELPSTSAVTVVSVVSGGSGSVALLEPWVMGVAKGPKGNEPQAIRWPWDSRFTLRTSTDAFQPQPPRATFQKKNRWRDYEEDKTQHVVFGSVVKPDKKCGGSWKKTKKLSGTWILSN